MDEHHHVRTWKSKASQILNRHIIKWSKFYNMRGTHTRLHQEKNEDIELQKLVLLMAMSPWGTRWEFRNCVLIILGCKPGFWAKTCGGSCCFQKEEFTVVLRTQLDYDNTGTCDVHGEYVFRKIFSKINVLDLLFLSPSHSPLSHDSLSSHQGFFFFKSS